MKNLMELESHLKIIVVILDSGKTNQQMGKLLGKKIFINGKGKMVTL